MIWHSNDRILSVMTKITQRCNDEISFRRCYEIQSHYYYLEDKVYSSKISIVPGVLCTVFIWASKNISH